MSKNNQDISNRQDLPALPSGNDSGSDQGSGVQEHSEFRPSQAQELEQEPWNVPGPGGLQQSHQPFPTLQDSFDTIDAWRDNWTREGLAARRAFHFPPMTPQQAALLRQTNIKRDAGDNEGLYGHADVDYMTMLQVSNHLKPNQNKRPRVDDSSDEGGPYDRLQPSDRRGVKQPRLGSEPGDEVHSISSTSVPRSPNPFPGSGRGRGASTGDAQHNHPSSSWQQSPYLSPSQWASNADPMPTYHRRTSGRESMFQPASGGGNAYNQPSTIFAQHLHRTEASPSLLSPNAPTRMQPQQTSISAIPFVNGQYQVTAWGRLDIVAAARVVDPMERHSQGGYGGDRLPPPPNPRTTRPAPNTKRTYPIRGYMVQARSGLDRTELYRALYASILSLLQFRVQLGEQQPQMWVKLKDYRYKEARNRLKDGFIAVRPGAGDKEFNAAIPDRENAAEGWNDYLEDWDLPYRGFLQNDECNRWLEYYWSSAERKKEKAAVAPLVFDGVFLQSEKAGKFWRQDIQEWELGNKVLVTWNGSQVVVLDMD